MALIAGPTTAAGAGIAPNPDDLANGDEAASFALDATHRVVEEQQTAHVRQAEMGGTQA